MNNFTDAKLLFAFEKSKYCFIFVTDYLYKFIKNDMELIELENKTKKEEDLAFRYFPKENPALTGKAPEGYMTGEEFVRIAKEHITKYFKDNGLL